MTAVKKEYIDIVGDEIRTKAEHWLHPTLAKKKQQLAIQRKHRDKWLAEQKRKAAKVKKDWDEFKHPRDPGGTAGGQFVSGGGGGGGAGEAEAAGSTPKLDPKVVDVGGDEWNRATAVRLEKYYQEARSKLERLEQKAIGVVEPATMDTDEFEAAPPAYVPDSWHALSEDDKKQAKDQYFSVNLDYYHQNEIENWRNTLREQGADAGKEPPGYLMDSAREQLDESWKQMEDDEKYAWVENHTSILEQYEQLGLSGTTVELKVDQLPDKYDPLNNTSGDDYRRTQALARFLSRERAKEIMTERGIELPPDSELREIDNELWKGWKDSSTSKEGKLLQLATAEELGGRLNPKTRILIDVSGVKARANRVYPGIDGYDGVKALVRAKWETTQYLLDKAGEQELEVYRGMSLDRVLVQKLFKAKHASIARRVGGYEHLATMDIKRNGAASATTSLKIANDWGSGAPGKITMRMLVPRTAAVSIPAYGINIHSEQEVVLAGVAWKKWEVWNNKAPTPAEVPF